MKPPVLRLVIAAALFSGWLGWLGFLAFTAGTRPGVPRKPPVVLFHPQFLESNFDVVAEVAEVEGQADPHVKLVEVFCPESERIRPHPNMAVKNLQAAQGFAGPGQYLLPLVTTDFQ